MPKSRYLAEWFSAVLLMLCMAVALSAQSKGIDPALLAKAKAGDANSQFNIGMLYDSGQGVPKDHAEATRWFRKAAEQGNATAQYNIGVAYETGGDVPRDYVEAVKWFHKAAEQGDAFNEFYLGLVYHNGVDVPRNEVEAVKWWRKAAEQGNAPAQFHLGLAFCNGEGVPQDYAQAAFWYRKAAEQGHATAQYELALQLIGGWGVRQNIKEAMIQFQKAAEQGDVESEYMLGSIYEEGGLGKVVHGPDGSSRVLHPAENAPVPRDYGLAAKWYRKAAEQNNALAQNGLGRLYADGKGVPQEYIEAYFWLSLASANGSHSSTNDMDDRDLAASHLTKSVLLETQERARKWFEDHRAKPQ